jgi:hypothetical protein
LGSPRQTKTPTALAARCTALDLHYHIRALDKQACSLNRTINNTVGIKGE